MADTKTIRNGAEDSLRYKVFNGLSDNGTAKYKNITYSGINAELTDDDFMAVSDALISLMDIKLDSVHRINAVTLEHSTEA